MVDRFLQFSYGHFKQTLQIDIIRYDTIEEFNVDLKAEYTP